MHHFKWNARVVARLRDRIASRLRVGQGHIEECHRFLSLVERAGRIDLTGLETRECGPLKYHSEARARAEIAVDALPFNGGGMKLVYASSPSHDLLKEQVFLATLCEAWELIEIRFGHSGNGNFRTA